MLVEEDLAEAPPELLIPPQLRQAGHNVCLLQRQHFVLEYVMLGKQINLTTHTQPIGMLIYAPCSTTRLRG
jgi:hypothetical protein